MFTFLLRRLVAIPPLLLVISFLTFMLLQAAPGDYFSDKEADPKTSRDTLMGLRASAGKVVEVKAEDRARTLGTFTRAGRSYAFDAEGRIARDGVPLDPRTDQESLKKFVWPESGGSTWTVTPEGRVYRWVGAAEGYVLWLGRVFTGDLGKSLRYKESVGSLLVSRLWNTLKLNLVVLVLAWGIAIPLGVWSGVRPNSWVDHSCGAVAYVSLSVPSVFLALLAMLFAYHSGWFPVGGMRDSVRWDAMSGWEKLVNSAWHLVLPAVVVAATEIAGYMRRMRSQMVESMSQDYVRTARAKGVARRRVIFVHALRNAINPMVTLLGFSLAALLSGSFLVEVVTNWPGMAQITVAAVLARDDPLVLASILMATVLLVLGNLVADVLLAVVDPRDPARMKIPSPRDASTEAPAGPWTILFRRLRRNRVATIGGAILVVLYGAACFAGFLAPYRFDDADRDSSKAGPALFGNFVHESRVLDSEEEPGEKVTVWTRVWRWFDGGVHFRGPDGEFTLRPHIHPLVEKKFTDEYGDTSYSPAAADTSRSLPIEFFVDGPEHEVFSLLGLFPVKGTTHLFGVRAPEGFQGTARVYLLGSDPQGRDVLSRLLYGAQISLSVGVLGIAVSMTLGMLIGGLSGYLRGSFDFVAMRAVEVVLSVPSLYLIIVLGGFLQRWETSDGRPLSSRQTYLMIVGILAFIGWATTSRVIRGMVLSLREMDYVTSARALGIPAWRIILKHILPNTFSYAIVTATLYVPYYILGEVALSYLGLGIQEPEASWGNMLRDAQQATYLQENPWVVLPGVFIFLAVLAYNFLGDGLRDAADPRVVLLKPKA